MHQLGSVEVVWVEEKTQRGLLFRDGLGYKLMVAIFNNNNSKYIWQI